MGIFKRGRTPFISKAREEAGSTDSDWVEVKKRVAQELEQMDVTSKEDAMDIYHSIQIPSCDPEVATYQLLLLNEKIRSKINFYSLVEILKLVQSSTASNYADRGHKSNREAKKFIQMEWSKHRGAYDGNKSAFSRDYVKRVFNELNVSVTEKQMREIWLKDTPPAGKQAG